MLEDYMQDIYPGWSREAVTYSKYGNCQVLETLKGSRSTQGEHDGFSFLEVKGEDCI
ncbi:hypothetical protein [Eisenbergiella porci]|uniref:hypothetical protein n=1 Tax=Eisenbergiella porci TaxID=2652274 RepID=UPI0012DCECFD